MATTRFKGETAGERLDYTSISDADMVQVRHKPGTIEDADKGISKSQLQSCPFGVCDTSAGTAAKAASLTDSNPDFTLVSGREVVVCFTTANTASNPTLNFAGSGAIPLYMPNGAPVGAWNAGAWMHLKYFYATVGNSQIQRWILMSQEVDSEVIMASSTAITGKSLVSGASIKIMFTSDITGSNTSTVLSLTYNGTAYNVKVGKNGSLSNFVASEVSTGVYKYVQAYTTLELAFDGSQFIIIGNPVVLSSADYTIYADGRKSERKNYISRWVFASGEKSPGILSINTPGYNDNPNVYIENNKIRFRTDARYLLIVHIVGRTGNTGRLFVDVKGSNLTLHGISYGDYAEVDIVVPTQINNNSEIYVNLNEAFTVDGGQIESSYIALSPL